MRWVTGRINPGHLAGVEAGCRHCVVRVEAPISWAG